MTTQFLSVWLIASFFFYVHVISRSILFLFMLFIYYSSRLRHHPRYAFKIHPQDIASVPARARKVRDEYARWTMNPIFCSVLIFRYISFFIACFSLPLHAGKLHSRCFFSLAALSCSQLVSLSFFQASTVCLLNARFCRGLHSDRCNRLGRVLASGGFGNRASSLFLPPPLSNSFPL